MKQTKIVLKWKNNKNQKNYAMKKWSLTVRSGFHGAGNDGRFETWKGVLIYYDSCCILRDTKSYCVTKGIL